MSAVMKYTLGRIGIFAACAVVVVLVAPDRVDPLLKLVIAFLISAVVSYFALRGPKNQLAEAWAAKAQQRARERESLHSALAGDGALIRDEPLIRDEALTGDQPEPGQNRP